MTGRDTKFLLPEARPMYNLADERLARSQVTVRFNPHCTHRLKTSLRSTLFHPRIKFRNVLFQPMKQLWLALAIMVVGVALHQSQHIGDSMSNLLVGSPVRPHPPDIEMGMSADSDLRAVGPTINRGPTVECGFILHVVAKMRWQVLISGLSRGSETLNQPAPTQLEQGGGRDE